MSAILMPELIERLNAIPLKDQDGALLAANLRQHAITLAWPTDQLDDAIAIAAWAHAGALRANRGAFPVTSYVEHPLRVALRLCHWGVTDWRIVAAGVLHDVVEDAAHDLAQLRQPVGDLDEAHARTAALRLLDEQFDQDVAELVEHLSNPIPESEPRTLQHKRTEYAQHVLQVLADPRPGIVKTADLADNALSLHHNLVDESRRRIVGRMARKYRPAIVSVIAHADAGDFDSVVPTSSAQSIAIQFTAGLERLDDIIATTPEDDNQLN